MAVVTELICEYCESPIIGPKNVDCKECNVPGRLICVECCFSAHVDRPRKCKQLLQDLEDIALDARREQRHEQEPEEYQEQEEAPDDC